MQQDFTLSAYDYHLPEDRIAQHPADRRDHSRLLVLDNAGKTVSHRLFADIADLMQAGKEALDAAGIEIPFPHQVAVPYGDHEPSSVVPGATTPDTAFKAS